MQSRIEHALKARSNSPYIRANTEDACLSEETIMTSLIYRGVHHDHVAPKLITKAHLDKNFRYRGNKVYLAQKAKVHHQGMVYRGCHSQ